VGKPPVEGTITYSNTVFNRKEDREVKRTKKDKYCQNQMGKLLAIMHEYEQCPIEGDPCHYDQ
jgi:hypothetical protein